MKTPGGDTEQEKSGVPAGSSLFDTGYVHFIESQVSHLPGNNPLFP